MDSREYHSNYNHYYDPNQMYLADGMPHPAYFNPGHSWGWQGHGYHSGPQGPHFYGGYPQMEMNYGYGYDSHEGNMYNQPNFQSYENQENFNRRSKHSYSQNRSRNRPRFEHRHNNTDNIPSSHSQENLSQNNNSNNGANITTDSQQTDGNLDDIGLDVKNESETSKPHERFKGRGGRFHGVDGRTKHYDKDKQQLDRQKAYNKNYISEDMDHGMQKTSEESSDTKDNFDNGNAKRDNSKGARPKSYKESRKKESRNHDNVKKEISDNHRIKNYKSDGQANKSNEDESNSADGKDSKEDNGDNSKEYSGRKKKKEYQVGKYMYPRSCLKKKK